MFLFLVISLFTMLVSPVEGAAVSDQTLTHTEEIGWFTGVSINWRFSDEDSEPYQDVSVGQKNIEMTPRYRENLTQVVGDDVEIVEHNVVTEGIMRLTGDDWTSDSHLDWVDGSQYFEWEIHTLTDETGPFVGESFFVEPFEFGISNEATAGIYRIPIEMEIEYNDVTAGDTESYDELEYVWLEVGNAEVLDFELEPGIEFEQQNVGVRNIGDQHLEDVTLTLDENEEMDFTIHNPENRAYTDEIRTNQVSMFNFRFSVPLDTEPGEYDVDYTLEATRSDDAQTITEHGTVMVTINQIAELTATIEEEEKEIVQGIPKHSFDVEFENTGNLDLKRVSVAPLAIEPFSVPNEYYEHSMATRDDPKIWIGDLDVGDSETINITIGIEQDIQIGQHKLYFEYEAYYFDVKGEITGSEGFNEVHDAGLVADTDEPYEMITVNKPDVSREIRVRTLDTLSITDMGYQEIGFRLDNRGRVDYSDVNVRLHTEDTPFIHPTDPNQETIEMKGEPFTLDNFEYVYFDIMVNTAFIEQRLEQDRPIYTAELTFQGINADTLEEVEYTLNCEGYVQGVGPKIMVREPVDENKVEVGESFELTYIIENIGDEPVRNLEVTITPAAYDDGETVFEDGQEAIYYRQATIPPGAYISTVDPEQEVLEPGEYTNVTFNMKPSSDLQEGSLYFYELRIDGETSQGTTSWESGTTIRTVEESRTKPLLSYNITLILVAIILGASGVIAVFFYKKEREPKIPDEKDSYEESKHEKYTYEELDNEEIEPEPSENREWDEETPPPPEDEIFEEDESQIEPGDREDW